jgi:hypothetical protein
MMIIMLGGVLAVTGAGVLLLLPRVAEKQRRVLQTVGVFDLVAGLALMVAGVVLRLP